jgi:hypothetical protein
MVQVAHRNEDDEQRTRLTVETEDAVGNTHEHDFEGPHGGPLEYEGDGDPSDAMIEAVEAAPAYQWDEENGVVQPEGE